MASRDSPPCQAAPAGSGHVPVPPPLAGASCLEGEAALALGEQSLRAAQCPPGIALPVKRPWSEPLANSLEALLREKREQRDASPVLAPVDDATSTDSLDEDCRLPEEQRALLARFAVQSGSIPATHPGEPIFCARPAPEPTLNTHGLEPQSSLERFFLRDSPAGQTAFVCTGALSLLYRSVPTCPTPVLRWLFQLMTLRPAAAAAFRALWEIWLNAEGGQPWCPSTREISRAFARLGADLRPLRRLLPTKLCPAAARAQSPSGSPPRDSPDAALALATQLGDMCKFLALCVATRPCRYADGARLALVTILAFLGLDRALRCQPLPELQHLLQCLLEGIQHWQEQLPALCQALCQLSQHHHNVVAVVQLLPDLSSRGRELRQRLSLHAMARLLGRPPGTVPPAGAQTELAALSRLLARARPDALHGLVAAGGPGQPEDPEYEACYLSHSLLLLASNTVGNQPLAPEQRGHLERLCARLERHFRLALCRGTRLCYTQLGELATLLLGRWQEMLDEGRGGTGGGLGGPCHCPRGPPAPPTQ